MAKCWQTDSMVHVTICNAFIQVSIRMTTKKIWSAKAKHTLSHTDPQPLDAFDLVPPHYPSSEELWLLGGNWLAVYFSFRMQEMLGIVSHCLC